jgi:LysM repeat protein
LILTPKDFVSVPVVAPKPIVKQEEAKQPETIVENISKNPEYHIVVKGETIYRICAKYDITEEQLRMLNKIQGNNVMVGQKLRIR